MTLRRHPFFPFVPLVSDTAGAEQHQCHAEKVQYRRLFGLYAEDIMKDFESTPVRNRHVREDGRGEDHQSVSDFPRRRRGEGRSKGTLQWVAHGHISSEECVAERLHFFMNQKRLTARIYVF